MQILSFSTFDIRFYVSTILHHCVGWPYIYIYR